jgi:hypothetical protein
VTNGLTLNGSITFPALGGSKSINFSGTQSLSGTGEIVSLETNIAFAGITPSVGPLTIGPSVTIRGARIRVGQTGSSFVNHGTLLADGSGQFLVTGTGWSNQGQLSSVNGGDLYLQGTNWTNHATIASTGGDIRLEGSAWTNLGTISATSPAFVKIGGAGSTWTQQGTISNPGGTTELDGQYQIASLGNSNFSGGIVEIRGTVQGGILDADSQTASWRLDGAVLQGVTVVGLADLLVISASTLDACTVDGAIRYAANTSLTVTSGLTLNGTITFPPLGSTKSMTFSGTQTLSGTGEVLSLETSESRAIVAPGLGVLTIGPDITIRGASMRVGQASTTFINQGQLRAEANGQFLVTGSNWQNQGMISSSGGGDLLLQGTGGSNAGTLETTGVGSSIQIAGVLTQTSGLTKVSSGAVVSSSGGTFNLQGGVLEAAGMFTASLNSSSTVRIAGDEIGVLTITGNYNQQAGGTLAVQIGGELAGTEYDRLIASGGAQLGGLLEATLKNGYLPNLGDSFQLVGGTLGGSFASTNLPVLGPGLGWQVTGGSAQVIAVSP